ncbi:AraC-type DNA-binding protein [Marinobacter sp. es.048]|nr:AraC-type DNA-binding protein [Marinobacter sp. es.048]
MELRGHPVDEVLRGSHINRNTLDDSTLLISFAQYQTVIGNMIRLTGNQGIGFDIGSDFELADFGVVGHAMISAPTARHAVELWTRYSNTLVGTHIMTELVEQHDDTWSLNIEEMRPMGFVYNFGVEEIVMIVMKAGAALTHQAVIPKALYLSYAAPVHQEVYQRYLPCPVHFNSRSTRLVFEKLPLSQPLRSADSELNTICLRHCRQIMKHISETKPFSSRIRNLLLNQRQGGASLEVVSQLLGMSPRGVRRYLREEGYTFTDLVKEIRGELAKEYLRTSDMAAKEIAYALGFQDTNAFRRAFKSWTGLTINEYRDKVRD